MEPYEVDAFPFAMFGYLEEIQDSEKARLTCQLMSDVRQTDRFDREDFYLAFLHAIPATHGHVGARPDADSARDLSATNSITQSFRKGHVENVPGTEDDLRAVV